MGFFEFFFPEWAAAEHLKTLAEAKRREVRKRLRRRRVSPAPAGWGAGGKEAKDRIVELEKDVGFLSLLLLGILEELQVKGVLAKEDVLRSMKNMDLLDGAQDQAVDVRVLRTLYRAIHGSGKKDGGREPEG